MSEIPWKANGIRLTLFPSESLGVAQDFWRPIFGTEPDAEEVRPREGTKRQLGQWGDGHCEIQANPARFDLVIGPRAVEPAPGQVPSIDITIGPALDTLARLHERVAPWLAKLPFQINRMAVSGTALAQAPTQEDAYAILASHIRSVDVRPGAMKEFMYRVNWPKKSDILGHYNDLQTWSSMQMTLQVLNVGSNLEINVREENFAQLQFDANTPGDRREPLSADQLVTILGELVELVRSGIIEGERPSAA